MAYIDIIGLNELSQTQRILRSDRASAIPPICSERPIANSRALRPFKYQQSDLLSRKGCGLGILLVVGLLVVGLALLALLIFLVLRSIRTTQAIAVQYPASVTVPAYSAGPASVVYYKNQHQPDPPIGNALTYSTRRDPRNAPLARCPKCGTAIAFRDEQCPKCGVAIPR